MRHHRGTEATRRVETGAGERRHDQHAESQRATDHEAGPALEGGWVHRDAHNRPHEEERADRLAADAPEGVEVRRDDRGAVVHAAALVLDQSLREKRGGHPARELTQPVDDRVDGLDLADGEHSCGDRWVEVRARDDGQRLHEHEQHEHVHEPDH